MIRGTERGTTCLSVHSGNGIAHDTRDRRRGKLSHVHFGSGIAQDTRDRRRGKVTQCTRNSPLPSESEAIMVPFHRVNSVICPAAKASWMPRLCCRALKQFGSFIG